MKLFRKRVKPDRTKTRFCRLHVEALEDRRPLAVSIIDDGDPGYSTIGSWVTANQIGYQNHLQYLPAGAGTNVASWTFNNLPVGIYRVSTTWLADPNRASNVPFTVWDDTLKVASVAVNQELAPNDLADQGANWEDIGAPQAIYSGKLVVKMTDLANEYVIADAVRVEYVGAPQPIIVDDGDPGFTTAGPWIPFNSIGYQNDINYITAPLPPGGGTAKWSFPNLTRGVYRVSATWVADPNRTNQAQYFVWEDLFQLGEVFRNQRIAPDDILNDHGANWEDLGTYTIFGGTLDVRLNRPGVDFAIADAIRVEKIGNPQPQIIDDGDSRFLTDGNWIPTTQIGYQNDVKYLPAGTGQKVATWSFENLSPAFYRVSATWKPDPNRATNARYVLWDSEDIATVTINQELAPNDLLNDHGADWEDIGTFAVIRGSLAVRLSDLANEYVIADAIRIEAIEQPTTQIIDNGDIGYSTIGSWASTTGIGYQDDLQYQAAGGGQNVAMWRFRFGLILGTYRISATWKEDPNRASNAKIDFQASLGNGSKTVNMQLPPDDFVDHGVGWEDIGTFSLVDGRFITVRLTDLANGFVIADAIRVELISVFLPL